MGDTSLWDCDISDKHLCEVMDKFESEKLAGVIPSSYVHLCQPMQSTLHANSTVKDHIIPVPEYWMTHSSPADKFASVQSPSFSLGYTLDEPEKSAQ